jgi:hypothetical protein
MKPCVIKVGNNASLSALVQRELFAKNWKWMDGVTEVYDTTSSYGNETAFGLEGDKRFSFSPLHYYRGEHRYVSAQVIDLTTGPITNVTALLEYLDAPEVPEKPKLTVEWNGTQPVEVTRAGVWIGPRPLPVFYLYAHELDAIHAASLEARKK